MSKRSVADWLGDIISWGERLESHIVGMTYGDFIKDAKTQDAASKCAESIGLAANELSKLDPSLEREFPNLQLDRAYKSRNKLSHGYYAVEQEIVWTTVTESIPRTVAAARQAKLKHDGNDGAEPTAGDRSEDR
jgi:uncharacterized protein with HEPN domain